MNGSPLLCQVNVKDSFDCVQVERHCKIVKRINLSHPVLIINSRNCVWLFSHVAVFACGGFAVRNQIRNALATCGIYSQTTNTIIYYFQKLLMIAVAVPFAIWGAKALGEIAFDQIKSSQITAAGGACFVEIKNSIGVEIQVRVLHQYTGHETEASGVHSIPVGGTKKMMKVHYNYGLMTIGVDNWIIEVAEKDKMFRSGAPIGCKWKVHTLRSGDHEKTLTIILTPGSVRFTSPGGGDSTTSLDRV